MAAGTSFDQFIKNHLECSICQERFIQPKTLGCEHSFCEKCLTAYYVGRQKSGAKIICPRCRQETALPQAGIQGLKTNFNLTNMLQDISPPPKAKTSPREESTNMCKKHHGEVKWLYCETCEELICNKCTARDHRKPNHCYIDTENASLKRREILKGLFPALDEKIHEYEQTLAATSEAKQKFACRIRQSTEEVKKRASEMRAMTASQESQLIHQIKKLDKKYSQTFDDHEKTVGEMLHSLKTAKDIAENALDNDFLALYPTISQDKQMLSSRHKHPQIDLRFPHVNFQPCSDINLGKLKLQMWEMCCEFGHFISAEDVHVGISDRNEVAVIDSLNSCLEFFSTSGQRRRSYPLQERPSGIAATEYTLVITNFPSQRVSCLGSCHGFYTFPLLDPAQSWGEFFFKLLSYLTVTTVALPLSVAAKPSGTIVVGDILRKVLTVHTPSGSLQRTISLTVKPWYLAIDDVNDRFVVSDKNQGVVAAVKDNGNELFTIAPIIMGEEKTYPTGVCCDPSGIYVAMRGKESGTGHVHHYSANGGFLSCIIQGLHKPWGITFTNDGKQLVVADTHTVKMFHKL